MKHWHFFDCLESLTPDSDRLGSLHAEGKGGGISQPQGPARAQRVRFAFDLRTYGGRTAAVPGIVEMAARPAKTLRAGSGAIIRPSEAKRRPARDPVPRRPGPQHGLTMTNW